MYTWPLLFSWFLCFSYFCIEHCKTLECWLIFSNLNLLINCENTLKKIVNLICTKVFSFSIFHMHRTRVGHCHCGDKDKKRNGIWNLEKCVLLCYLCTFPSLVVILLLVNTIRVCEFGVKSLPYPYYHFWTFHYTFHWTCFNIWFHFITYFVKG